jgi:flavin reductase (DIM6/NTAB) family NADH-FMN oxidoreductase RutF
VSLECRLFGTMNCGSHDLVIGEIVETYVDKEAITGGTPDIKKVDPIIYSDAKYYRIGDFITDAYTAGKAYKKK